jgi:hypothetical protein
MGVCNQQIVPQVAADAKLRHGAPLVVGISRPPGYNPANLQRCAYPRVPAWSHPGYTDAVIP